MRQFLSETFSSLKVRNYRIYYCAQIVSVSGTFLQALAQDWLVLQLTNSGTMLGLVSAVQFLPMLILTPYGGVIADRFPKLKLLYITQTSALVLSACLGILILLNVVQVWMVFIFALLLGLVNSLDSPVRQSFLFEMVGKDEVKNAVSIWTMLISMTRIIGPAIAGILIVTVGIGLCFIINAVSYLAVIGAFFFLRTSELNPAPLRPLVKGQIREALQYIKNTPILRTTLLVLAVLCIFSWEWQASLPLFAKFVLNGNAGTYSVLSVALAFGMLFGGFATTRSRDASEKTYVYSALCFGVCMIVASFARTIAFVVVGLAAAGFFSMIFANLSNSILQLNADERLRARVLSFWSMAYFGSTAIGGPIIGWVGQSYGAPWSLAVGGVAAIVAGSYGLFYLRHRSQAS